MPLFWFSDHVRKIKLLLELTDFLFEVPDDTDVNKICVF